MTMRTKIVELEQKRNLIESNFSGYKLSLESVPVFRQDLDPQFQPIKAKLLENQYSFLHTELYSLQNLLEQDQWNRSASYFISKSGLILKCAFDINTGRPMFPQIVYKIPTNLFHHQLGDYNLTLKFLSEKYCLICDGIETGFLFNTHDRSDQTRTRRLSSINQWTLIYKFQINEQYKSFILKDARLDLIDNHIELISLLFQRIEFNGKIHYTQLFWSTLTRTPPQLNATNTSDDNWVYKIEHILSGNGTLTYCAFEPNSQSLIISSNKRFQFNSIINNDDIIEIDNNQMLNKTEATYNWSQTNENIIISYEKDENKNINDFNILITSRTVIINDIDQTLFELHLYEIIDDSSAKHIWDKNILTITLTKINTDEHWPSLIQMNQFEDLHINDEKTITNLEAPIEDCDFPDNTFDEYFIERLHSKSKDVTHRVLLGSSPPLFSKTLIAGYPAAVVTRTDIDASLWLQELNPMQSATTSTNEDDEWFLRHEANLHAFGYVQASKLQKKFMNCAQDMSYSVICESFRHVFIYRTDNENANGLRNRNGPQIKIGKQSLVTLDDAGEVIGMQCDTNFIVLLTEKCLLYLQIN